MNTDVHDDNFCFDKRIGYFRNPTSCSKYYMCVAKRTFKLECNNGLYWNEKERFCDWAANVPCNVNGGILKGAVTEKPPIVTSTPSQDPSMYIIFMLCMNYFRKSHEWYRGYVHCLLFSGAI